MEGLRVDVVVECGVADRLLSDHTVNEVFVHFGALLAELGQGGGGLLDVASEIRCLDRVQEVSVCAFE